MSPPHCHPSVKWPLLLAVSRADCARPRAQWGGPSEVYVPEEDILKNACYYPLKSSFLALKPIALSKI